MSNKTAQAIHDKHVTPFFSYSSSPIGSASDLVVLVSFKSKENNEPRDISFVTNTEYFRLSESFGGAKILPIEKKYLSLETFQEDKADDFVKELQQAFNNLESKHMLVQDLFSVNI